MGNITAYRIMVVSCDVYIYLFLDLFVIRMTANNANTRFFALSITSASITVLLVIISLATPHWESHEFDQQCVISKNTSNSLVISQEDYFTLILSSNYTAADSNHVDQVVVDNGDVVDAKVYPIFNKYAGIWTICNQISGALDFSLI